MQNPQLQWGRPIPPGEYLAAWGARAIFTHRKIDLLHDRQDIAGPDDARKTLADWLHRSAIPRLQEKVRANRHAKQFKIEDPFFTLEASTIYNDYLYMAATIKGSETRPEGKWSGDFMPEIGDTVLIPFNDLGKGRVIGWFTEYSWLGVHVHLFNPPEWHRRDVRTDVACLLGSEIRRP